MKTEDRSCPLPEAQTAEPVSPAATEARAPYLTGTQNTASPREIDSDSACAKDAYRDSMNSEFKV